MTDIDARPRSATEIIDATFQLYRQNFATYVITGSALYIPWLLIRFFLVQDSSPDEALEPGIVVLRLVATIVSGFVVSLFGGTMIVITSQLYMGRTVDTAAAVRTAFRRWWPIMVANISLALLTTLGFVLLIVPGLYAAARYGVSPAVAALEPVDGTEAMSRASVLSKDLKKHILGSFTLVFLVYVVVFIAAGILFSFLFSARATNVAMEIVPILIGPPVGIATALLYYDLRIRTEGYDIHLLADRLGDSTTAPFPS